LFYYLRPGQPLDHDKKFLVFIEIFYVSINYFQPGPKTDIYHSVSVFLGLLCCSSWKI